jgi:hypothetical protein
MNTMQIQLQLQQIQLQLKLCKLILIKNKRTITEQLFMINSVISSSPTDLAGFSLQMASQTSASETGTRNKDSENCTMGGGDVHRAMVIINRVKMLSESISNCTGLE